MEAGIYQITSDLTLSMSDDGRELLARFPEAVEREPIQLAWFQEQLHAHGLDKLRLVNDAVGQCIQQYNEGSTATSIVIGETVDAEFSIKVSDDDMQVSLSYSPAQGGLALEKKQVMAALHKQGITFGIQESVIDQVLQGKEAHDVVIAAGEPAIDGEDGRFEKLVTDIRDRRPRIDDQGKAHYNDITQFVTVQAGEALIRRLPPGEGKAGQNVRGEIIPAKPGEAVMFAANLSGTKLSENDPNILVAEIYGQPVFVENGALVESTITVDDVDQSTGNIEFEGSVMVNGNVTTGMRIDAKGDVLINGMVEEASQITAGGDIIIQQGVIGRGSITEDNGKPGKGVVRLESEGSISARFIENSCVSAGREVRVSELIAHSDVSARHAVIVGNKNSKRGHIMGGITRAEDYLQAEILGSPAAVNTRVIVGVNPEYNAALQETQQLLESKKTERNGLEEVLSRAIKQQAKNRNEILQKLQATLNHLANDINQLEQLKQQQKAQVERLKQARVTVNRKAFNSVEITVANFQEKLADEKGGGTYLIREGEFAFDYR